MPEQAPRQVNSASSDRTLVRASREGDDGAFALLVRRHTSAVYKFSYRYVRTGADAEDITQEAFVRVWRHLRRFDETKPFTTWLFTIARNAALDFIKKKKPLLFSQVAAGEGALDALFAPKLAHVEIADAAFDRTLAKEGLARVLRALPPAYRTVLAMRYENSLKFREIAEALGEPIDTVKSRHRRGLLLVKKLLAEGRPETGLTPQA